MNMRKLTILAVLTTGLLALSCGSKSDGGGDRLQGEIQIDGSSTVYPITEAIAEEFRIEQPDVEVTIPAEATNDLQLERALELLLGAATPTP